MFKDLEGQIEKIYYDNIEMVYYMRGAISLYESFEMTTVEKNITIKFLNKHLELESKKRVPNY
jgi:hypothetical protein